MSRLAAAWLALVSWLVPDARRQDWLEEWRAELWQLGQRTARARGRNGREAWALARYLAGAPRSALWELKEEWMTDLWQDIRYGLRGLARAPGFLAVAVVTLALGIGVNTTVFTLVNGLLFRDPPQVAAPDDLVRLGRGNDKFDNWSYPVFQDFRARTGDWFSGVAGFASAGAIIGQGTAAEAVPVQMVSDNFFQVLGVPLALGRGFLPEDAAVAGGGAVAVISHDLWRRRFDASAEVIGATIPVNGLTYEVVGVAPAGFSGADLFTEAPDLWIPATMVATVFGPGAESMLERRGSSWFWLFARLAPGVPYDAAADATTALYARFDEEHPNLAGQGITVIPGVAMTPDDRAAARRMSGLLGGIVLLVLLVACANLAGIALARGAARREEMSVRAALGASRPRVVRQLMTEALLVAAFGGLAALAITVVFARRIPDFVPYELAFPFVPDARVLLFGLGTATAAGLLFGLVPALAASRSDLRDALTTGARSARGGTRLRRGLVAGQLALSFVLLAGTGLLLRSLQEAQTVDPGFDPDRAAIISLDAGMRSGYDDDRGRVFYDRLREEAAALPGVEAVGLVAELPIVDYPSNHTPMTPETIDPAFVRQGPPPAPVATNTADAGYFEAVGLELLAGRTFQPSDYGENAEPVIVIDRTLAERFFGDENPVGQLVPFFADPDDEPTRVIGVVAGHRNRSLRADPWAGYWIPFDRHYRGRMNLVVRTSGDPRALAPRLAALVERLDPGMPIRRGASLRQMVGGTLRETRMVSSLIAAVGILALLLAAVGLYGVTAFAVARRTRELGIRMAVGATARNVLGLVMRQALVVAGIGLLVGVPLAIVGLRVLRNLLFGISPTDPVALSAGALALVGAAIVAALVPALRATRVEPVTALRQD